MQDAVVELPENSAKDINVPDKPFDITKLPQVEKKAIPAVSRLKEYISTLPETQSKNAEINLNKKHNSSDMTVAQFVESNADASFYKEGKLYYMEKDGRKLPVKKSMYDYAKYLQSATDTDVGTTETVEEKPTVDTTGYGNAKVIGKKGDVDILDSIPEGWKRFDMQTAPAGYEGVTNNKSLFGGERKSALVARDVAIKKPQAVMPVYNAEGQLEQGTLYGSFETDSEEIRLKNKENYVKDTEYLREFIGRDEDADISEINMMDDLHEVVNNSPEYESIKKEFSTEDMKLLKETDADLYEELMGVGNYTPESYDAQINYWNKLRENFKSNAYRKYIDEAIENRNENQAVSKKAAERIKKAKASEKMTPQWLSVENNSQNIEKPSGNSYNVNKEGDNNGKENNASGTVQQNQRKVRTGAEIRADGRGRAESQSSNRGIGENRKLPEENRRERIGQGKDCVYYAISKNEYSQIAKETIKEMAKLGIKPDVYGGDMLVNGKPRGKKADATTFDDGTVAVNNNATQVPPKESAGHEAVHHYLATGNEAAIEYKRVFDENFEVLSDAAVDLTELIQKEYSGDLTEEYK